MRAISRSAVLVAVVACVLHGCGPSWSPVEHRSDKQDSYGLTPDGHYRVRRGDSLYTIAFRFGLDWRKIAEWNGIRAPYTIYPDQDLRLSPPARSTARTTARVETRPAPLPGTSVSRDQQSDAGQGQGEQAVPAVGPQSATPPPGPAAEESQASATAKAAAATTAPGRDPGKWLWPTQGRLLSSFKANDPSRNGIEIGGDEGQPIIAAAAGQVVYSGSGLIGYGELIIVKHSDRLLSAYAHNRKRLVSEGQSVAAGEMLAEMGRDDRNQPMLHFEIRVNGAPQDPMKYLPSR